MWTQQQNFFVWGAATHFLVSLLQSNKLNSKDLQLPFQPKNQLETLLGSRREMILVNQIKIYRVLIINYKMKENRHLSKKKRKLREQVQVEQTYFKQILKNIENIQTTILKKLQKHPQTPSQLFLTPKLKKSRKTDSSNKKTGNTTYHSQRLMTAANHTVSPIRNKQKIIDFTDYRNYQTMKMKTQSPHICKKPLQTFPITSGFQINHSQADPLSKVMKTTRFSSLNNKQPQKKQNDRQLQFARTHRDIQKLLRNKAITQQYYSYRFDPPKAHRNPEDTTDNIQEFYKRQIEKLQFKNKISSLQQELQHCIFQRKKADLCESLFIRAKMKKISLQIKQLKSISQAKQ